MNGAYKIGRLEHTRQHLRMPGRISRLQAHSRGGFIEKLRYPLRYMVHV